jgi:2-dehydropantoate 2-reductase
VRFNLKQEDLPMKTMIMGAGSLGILFGAHLAKGGVDVTLVDIMQGNVDALNSKGARVTGTVEMCVPVKACTPDKLEGVFDLVLLLTKQVSNPVSFPRIMAHIHEKSTVVAMQNGVPETAVAEYFGKERTLGCPVGPGAVWLSPGLSESMTSLERIREHACDLGELDGRITPRLKEVQARLEHVGKVHLLTNIWGARWSKLFINSTFSGLSAALNCTFGDVLANDTALYCASRIGDEVVKVAGAQGIKLEPMQGERITDFELTEPVDVPAKRKLYHNLFSPHAKLKASMLQDMEKGRECEILFINGHVSACGRKAGDPTPDNDMVVALVQEAQKRGVLPVFNDNLARFHVLGARPFV